ncbi:hypothetical protein HDV05_005417 [Chytridiales sp. JEL 0842]|nr:hypothetical protein HDV05_005417 [Chytridiales sp. JEL 0842]
MADTKTVPSDLYGLVAPFGIQMALTFGMIIGFSLLRPANKIIYQPRLKFAPDGRKPQKLGPAITAWMKPIFKTTADQQVRMLGLDAVMFLKIVKFMFILFAILSFFGIPLCFFNGFFPKIYGAPVDNGFVVSSSVSTGENPGNKGGQTGEGTETIISGEFPSATVSDDAASSTGSSVVPSATATESSSVVLPSATETSALPSVPAPSSSEPAPAQPTGGAGGASSSAATGPQPTGGVVGRREEEGLVAYNTPNLVKKDNVHPEPIAAIPINKLYWEGLQKSGDLTANIVHRRQAPTEDSTNATAAAPPFINVALSALTISSIDSRSAWFWLPASLTWVISLIIYYMLYNLWRDYIRFRTEYFESIEFTESLHNRALLLTTLPESLQNVEGLENFVSSLGLRSKPAQTIVNPDVGDLPKLVEKHSALTRKFEQLLAKFFKDPNNLPPRPTVSTPEGTKDAIEYYGQQLREFEAEIYKTRAQIETTWKPTASGFVSFASVASAHTSAQKLKSNPTLVTSTLQKSSMNATNVLVPPKIKLSPDFDEIIWENVIISPPLRLTRRLIALGLAVGLTIGWTFFCGFLSGTANLVVFFRGIPEVRDWFIRNPAIAGTLQFIIPSVLLAVANAILAPMALRIICRLQGVSSTHGVEKSVLYKLFVFQVYQVFIVIIIPILFAPVDGSNPNVVDIYKARITDALNSLANNSSLYIASLFALVSGYGIELIQGVPLIINFIQRRLFFQTPRSTMELNKPPEFNFAQIYGSIMLAFLTSLTFCIVSPLVTPFAALFFGIGFAVMKYQFMYVYEVRRETGGTWFPKVFDLITASILFFQLLTLAVIFVKTRTNGRQWVAIAPLPFVTAALWILVLKFLAPRAYFAIPPQTSSAADEYHHHQPPSPPPKESFSDHLETQAAHPALVKPLLKVWVPKQAKHLLEKFYKPQYDNLDAFISQNPAVYQAYMEMGWHHRRFKLDMGTMKRKQEERKMIKARKVATHALGAGKGKKGGADFDDDDEEEVPVSVAGQGRFEVVLDQEEDDDVAPEELQEEQEVERRRASGMMY